MWKRGEFARRLEAARDKGGLTTADLTVWFERPYCTVRTWIALKRDPWGPIGVQARERLIALELLIKNKKGFPVPAGLSPQLRREHMIGVRRATNFARADSRLLRTHSA